MGEARRGSPYTPGQYPVADLLLGMVADPSNEVPLGPALKGMQAVINPGLLSAGGGRMLKALQSLKGSKWKDLVERLKSPEVSPLRAADELESLGASRFGNAEFKKPGDTLNPPGVATTGKYTLENGRFITNGHLSPKNLKTLGNAIEKQPLDDVSMSYVKGGGEGGGADYAIPKNPTAASEPMSNALRERLGELEKAQHGGLIPAEWDELKKLSEMAKEQGVTSIPPKYPSRITGGETELFSLPEASIDHRGNTGRYAAKLRGEMAKERIAAGDGITLSPIEGGAAEAATEIDPAVWGLEARQARAAAEDAAEEAAAKQRWAQKPTQRWIPGPGEVGNGPKIAEAMGPEGLFGSSLSRGNTAQEIIQQRTIEALRRRASKEPLTLSPLSKLPE